MKKQYYFENEDSEICYTESHFQDIMKFEKVETIVVYEAVPDKINGIFWCRHEAFCGNDSSDTCGKQCRSYSPRNGKSGCYKYYTTKIYVCGNKITLKQAR